MIQLIVDQTNLYARQRKVKHWTDTNSKEITAFLGLLVGFSFHHVPSTELYWSTDPLFCVPPISNVMPVKCFKKLLQCLHINDNSLMPAKGAAHYDKIYKIRPLVEKLNRQLSAQCICTSSQSIDEAMVLFKGRSKIKQYMPMKPTKRGYKVWVRCDAKVGYAFQFDIYTGKAVLVEELCPFDAVIARQRCSRSVWQLFFIRQAYGGHIQWWHLCHSHCTL